MEYASTVWSPHQEELRHYIEMVQRRAAGYVMARYRTMDSVTAVLQELSLNTLKQWRLKARITMGYCIINNLMMIPADQLEQKEESSASTRGHDS